MLFKALSDLLLLDFFFFYAVALTSAGCSPPPLSQSSHARAQDGAVVLFSWPPSFLLRGRLSGETRPSLSIHWCVPAAAQDGLGLAGLATGCRLSNRGGDATE